MRGSSMLAVACVVASSGLAANQGCGCGPVRGAYLTASVLRYDADGWAQQAGLVRGRAFAAAVPIDADHYLVVGGYNAARDGDPADASSTIELCSLTSGCAIYSEGNP